MAAPFPSESLLDPTADSDNEDGKRRPVLKTFDNMNHLIIGWKRFSIFIQMNDPFWMDRYNWVTICQSIIRNWDELIMRNSNYSSSNNSISNSDNGIIDYHDHGGIKIWKYGRRNNDNDNNEYKLIHLCDVLVL